MLISNVQAIPIFNFMKSNESPRSIKLRCDFAVDTIYEVLLTQERQLAKFETARSIYFDASGCANDVLFECLETGQRITFKAGKQGYRNVLVSMGMRFRLSGTSPDVFLGNLLNVDMPESEWPLSTSIPDSIPLSSLVNAAAQFDVIGRKSAGPGAWEDCTRLEVNIPGLELNNTFTGNNVFNSGLNEFSRYSASAAGQLLRNAKARGTISVPAVVVTNDYTVYQSRMYDGATFRTNGELQFLMTAAAPGPADMQTRFVVLTCPAASVTATEIFSASHVTGLRQAGNTIVDANRLFKRRAYTFATLPAAAASQDGFAVITDGAAAPAWNAAAAGGGAVRTPVWSTGAAWQNG